MKITVTEDHIKNGKRHDATGCPIALALQPYGLSPSVGPSSANWRKFNGKYNTFYKGYLPIEAQSFIQMFDHGHAVKPFEFEMETVEIL